MTKDQLLAEIANYLEENPKEDFIVLLGNKEKLDFELGVAKHVEEKFKSGNDIPVTRITVTLDELNDIYSNVEILGMGEG